MSDVTVESLQEELTAAKTALEEASKAQPNKVDQDRLTYLEGEHKTLIKARDDLKEANRIADEKRLADQGEYKTIAEQRQIEADDLKKQLDSTNGRLAEYDKRDEEELATLLPHVAEELRGDVSNEALPLSTRLSLARKLAGAKGKPPGFKQPGEGGDDKSINRQAFDAKSPADKSAFIKDGGKVTD